MLCGTYGGSSANLYLDGSLVAGGTASQVSFPSIKIGDGTNTQVLGQYYDYYFPGEISNLQLYGLTLSAGQVMQLYKEGISGVPASSSTLLAWYPLDGDASDYSGNNNNGQLFGNADFALTPVLSSDANATYTLASSFDGATSVVNTPLVQSASALTATLWVNASSFSAMTGSTGYALLSSTGASGSNSIAIYLRSGAGWAQPPAQGTSSSASRHPATATGATG